MPEREGEVEAWKEKIKQKGDVTVDIETEGPGDLGLNPRRGVLRGIGFGWEDEQVYFSFKKDSDHYVPRVYFKRAFQEIFANPNIITIYWNASFDTQFLKEKGFEIRNTVADPMIALYLLDEDRGRKSGSGDEKYNYRLKDVVLTEYGHKMEEFGQQGRLFHDEMADYCMADVEWTDRLWRDLYPQVKEQGMDQLMWEVEFPVAELLGEMELAGLPIDREKLENYKEELESEVQKLNKETNHLADRRFQIRKTSELCDVLFSDLEVEAVKGINDPTNVKYIRVAGEVNHEPDAHQKSIVFEGGVEVSLTPNSHEPQLNKNTFQDLKRQFSGSKEALIDKILDYKSSYKLLSTYVKPFLERVNDNVDNRIHGGWNQTGTRIGRLSCLSVDERLLIEDRGMVPIEDVSIGDRVQSADGWKTITDKEFTGRKEAYKIRLSNGAKVVCSSDHKFKRSDGEWVELSDIEEGDNIFQSTEDMWRSLGNHRFEDCWFANEEGAFVAGFLTAEACVSGKDGKPYLTTVSAHKDEEGILRQVEDILCSEYDVNSKIVEDGNGRNLRMCGIEMGYELRDKLEIELSHNLKVPSWLFQSSKEVVTHWLRGYFQGDGHVGPQGRVKVTSTSRKLLDEVKRLLSGLGIKSYISLHEDREKKNGQRNSWRLHVASSDIGKFRDVIGFQTDKKIDKLNQDIDSVNRQEARIDIRGLVNDDILDVLPSCNTREHRWIESLRKVFDETRKQNNQTVSYPTAKKLVGWCRSNEYIKTTEKLADVVDKEYSTVSVESVEDLGRQVEMVDIEVEGREYLVNGLVTHNSSNPNLQNLPRDKTIRSLIQAEEGRILVGGDLSQVELRMMAELSGDETMIDIYRDEEGDIHSDTAEMLGIDRQYAKRVNFLTQYGGGAYSLQSSVYEDTGEKLPMGRCEEIIEMWYDLYSGVAEFKEKVKAKLERDGYVETYYGRRRRLADELEEDRDYAYRQAVQFVISGTAADMLKIVMVRVDERMKELEKYWDSRYGDIDLLLQVHDELIYDCPVGISGDFYEEMLKEMEDFPEFDIPIEADADIAKRWSDIK